MSVPMVSGAKPVIGHGAEFYRSPEGLFRRGFAEHGDVFGFTLPGRTAVALLGPEQSRTFFAETDRALSVRPAYPFIARMFDPDFFFVADTEEYKRQRLVVLPRFQGRQLHGYVSAMDAEATALIEKLGDSGEFDVTEHFAPLAVRIATRCFLGQDLAAAVDQGFFAQFRRFSGGIASFPRGDWPLPKFVRAKRARDRLRVILGDLIAARRATPLDPPDFLQALAEAQYPDGSPVPDLVVINLILLLIVGGHETTAGHMSWALLDLVDHQEQLAQATAEALTCTDFDDIASVKPLVHLEACLLETERLHPVANLLAREAVATFQVGDHTIPAGALVFASPAVSHRLSAQWQAPDEYRPDRFMGEDGQLARRQLIGFGGGSHRCIGLNFAHLEMKVVLARLLANYSWELAGPMPPPISGMHAKWPALPCRVRYRRRARTSPVPGATSAREIP
jgi:sterol 14-demethylase